MLIDRTKMYDMPDGNEGSPGQVAPDQMARLSEAIERLASGQQTVQETTEDLPGPTSEEFDKKLQEAIDEGDTAAALGLVQERVLQEQTKAQGTTVAVLAQQAEELAHARIPELDEWKEEILAEAKRRGISTHSWTSVQQWKEALDYVKSQNVDKIVEKKLDARREELIRELEDKQAKEKVPRFAKGSTREDGSVEEIDMSELPARAVRFCEALRVPLSDYAKAHAKIKDAVSFDGSVEKATFLDEEADEFGDIIIKRGAF